MSAKRRRLRGKKLLIVAGSLAGVSFVACGDDGGTTDGAADSTIDTAIADSAVANLLPPPDSAFDAPPADSAVDATGDGSMDATMDAASDGASDGASDASGDTLAPFDAPIANLLPPPDSSSS